MTSSFDVLAQRPPSRERLTPSPVRPVPASVRLRRLYDPRHPAHAHRLRVLQPARERAAALDPDPGCRSGSLDLARGQHLRGHGGNDGYGLTVRGSETKSRVQGASRRSPRNRHVAAMIESILPVPIPRRGRVTTNVREQSPRPDSTPPFWAGHEALLDAQWPANRPSPPVPRARRTATDAADVRTRVTPLSLPA